MAGAAAENGPELGDKPSSTSSQGETDNAPPKEVEEVAEAAAPASAETATQPNASSGDVPDGGVAAWTVVAGGWCAMFVSVGWNNSVGIFQTIYETDQLASYSPSAVGWINSLQTFFMFASAPIWGKVFDSYGPRYALVAGTLVHVFGIMMMSLSSKYYQFALSQSVCTGLGAGAIFFSASNTIATWFKRNRALALGIASSGSAIGGVVIPIMVNRIYHTAGFGWALRAVGFVFLGLLAIGNTFIKSRVHPTPKRFHIMDFINPLKEPRFLLVALACFSFAMAVYLPATFIILDSTSRGMDYNLASYLLAIMNAVSAVGRVVAGRVADKIGRFNTMILTTLLSAIFVLALWIPASSTAPLIVFSAFVGFTNGAYVALVSALVAQISDIKQIGTRNGTNWFAYSLGALIGTPVAGALIVRDGGGYMYMQIFSGVAMFISTCFFLASRTVQVGPAWKWI
ncbi:MFS monocarboxylate transporter [Xylariales sp. PMI_506]|nr:MFS monocarboxylate transporter [Xylariales sp. PMI_506]